MNLRNVALLIFLIGLSFQLEIDSFLSTNKYEEIKESNKNNNNKTDENDGINFFFSLIIISNYILLFFSFL
jgi:hypothetical protein